MTTATLHTKCRNSIYPNTTDLKRIYVSDSKIKWSAPWDDYRPVVHTDPVVFGKIWADPDIQSDKSIKLNFNQIDGKIDRTSFTGTYQLNSDGLPLNPFGRTGVSGRGLLGRWGPNHAADPIVTRWKENTIGILQFVAIKRKDSGEWAIPGGMVDAGEQYTDTLKREFSEEALNSMGLLPDELKKVKERVDNAFQHGVVIYKGYVDDPRNTDNAWMETVAVNFHDEHGDGLGVFPLVAGDDAGAVCWMDVSSNLKLYASHRDFIECVAKLRNAKW